MGEQVAAGLKKRGRSSVGRAPALQAGGQEFESLRLHLSMKVLIARKMLPSFHSVPSKCSNST